MPVYGLFLCTQHKSIKEVLLCFSADAVRAHLAWRSPAVPVEELDVEEKPVYTSESNLCRLSVTLNTSILPVVQRM